MGVVSSISQSCGIIADLPNRAMSTRAVPPLEPSPNKNTIPEPQTPSLSRETPTAKVPSSPEPAQEDMIITKLPSPSHPSAVETGLASWYGPGFHGKLTASGEVFNQEKFTAAHRTFPWGSRVRVTNLANGKSVIVQINDRGPAVKGRIIDLSRAAARALDMVAAGITAVRVEWLSESDKSNELVLQRR
jgi:rare lipoprotein A